MVSTFNCVLTITINIRYCHSFKSYKVQSWKAVYISRRCKSQRKTQGPEEMYSVLIFGLKFSSNLQKTCLTCRSKLCFTATLRHAWPVNSDNSGNVSSFAYHTWVFWCDQGNSKRNYKIRKKIWGFNGLSQCSDLVIVTLSIENSGQVNLTVRKSEGRRIVDLYLSGEGPREISPTVRVTYGGVCRIIRHYQTYGTYFPLSRGGRRNPSKLSDNVLESIELFKLMKPSMFGRERKVVEQWSVRWEKPTGFIDSKQGSEYHAPHNKWINTRLNRGYIRRYFLFPQVLDFLSLIWRSFPGILHFNEISVVPMWSSLSNSKKSVYWKTRITCST